MAKKKRKISPRKRRKHPLIANNKIIEKAVPRAWRDSYSLATILIFLSVLAFASQLPNTPMIGVILFFMGLLAFKHARKLQKKGSDVHDWASVKILQSLILISLGVAMILFLPDAFFGISLMTILVGFFWFTYYKFRYFHAER